MTIFLVVATDTDDFENIVAFRERAGADAEAKRLNAEAEEKRSYNYRLDELLSTEEPEIAPGNQWDGDEWERFKSKWHKQRCADAAVVMQAAFPRLTAENSNIESSLLYFDADYEYSVEVLELR